MKKIIDCTLRDGGYHTKWNFNKEFLDSYFNLLKVNPYLEAEIGYKRHSLSVDDSSLGKLAFCNQTFLNYLEKFNLKNKLWIMIDVKELKNLGLSTSVYLDNLSIFKDSLLPVKSIRLAVSLNNLNYAISLSKELTRRNFEVAINIMNVFNRDIDAIKIALKNIQDLSISRIYFADSEGIGKPSDLENLINNITPIVKREIDLGFHSHNNNGMSMAWCLEPIAEKISACDGSFLGFGRGAGNASTESLIAYFQDLTPLQCSCILDFIEKFIKPLQIKYNWGSNLATIIGSKFKLNQTQLVNFLEPSQFNKFEKISAMYKYNYLSNKKVKEEKSYRPILNKIEDKTVLIIAPGQTMQDNSFFDSILTYINKFKPIVIEINVVNCLDHFEQRITCVNSIERLCQIFSRERIEPNCFLTSNQRIYSLIVENKEKSKVDLLDRKFFKNRFDEEQLSHSVCVALGYSEMKKVKNIILAGVDGEESIASRFSLVQRAIDNISKNIPIYSFTPTRHAVPLKLIHSII